jgi:6-phosphogluconolactonase
MESDNGSVSAFRIDPTTGALTAVPGSPFPAGSFPRSVAVDFLRRFVYVANGGSFPSFNGSVSAYRIAENGVLTPVAGSPFPAGILPTSLAVDLLGEFVHVANQGNSSVSGSNNVSAYRSENGVLTPVAKSPFAAGNTPYSVGIDLFGRFVYVGNGLTDNISAFRIGANGALAHVAGSPFATGILPRSVAFSP